MAKSLPIGFVQTVAANIRAEAGLRGVKQSDLSRAMGLAPSRINERWSGRVPWRLDDIEVVARLFGITPQYLCRAREAMAMAG